MENIQCYHLVSDRILCIYIDWLLENLRLNQVCVDGVAKHPHLSVYFDLSQREEAKGGGGEHASFLRFDLAEMFSNSLFAVVFNCREY